jgi:hypothetical protein
LDLPMGRVAVLGTNWFEKLEWIKQHTRPSEFFFDSWWPDVYYSLGLRNPAKVPYVTPTDYTRPEQVQDVIDGLERHRVHYLFWLPGLGSLLLADPKTDHLPPLRAYVRDHYRVAKTFIDGSQIWERVR